MSPVAGCSCSGSSPGTSPAVQLGLLSTCCARGIEQHVKRPMSGCSMHDSMPRPASMQCTTSWSLSGLVAGLVSGVLAVSGYSMSQGLSGAHSISRHPRHLLRHSNHAAGHQSHSTLCRWPAQSDLASWHSTNGLARLASTLYPKLELGMVLAGRRSRRTSRPRPSCCTRPSMQSCPPQPGATKSTPPALRWPSAFPANGPGRPGTPHGATTAWSPATWGELSLRQRHMET